MKHLKLITFLLLLTLAGRAQIVNTCPFITSSSLLYVSPYQGGPRYTAKVQFISSSNVTGTNGVLVIVYDGIKTASYTPPILYQECITVPSNTVEATFETNIFPSILPGESYTYEIIKYVSNSCGNGPIVCMRSVTGPGSAVLPIKLSSFNGYREKNGVQLNWTSAQESNAAYYELEKNNGTGFQPVGKTNATNLSTESKYSFEDVNASKSAILYRLKLADKDGSFSFSNIVSIKAISSVSNVDIYPNPAVTGNAKLKISDISDITNVQVYDMSGRILKNITITNNDVNIGDLKAGSYLLKMNNAKTGGSESKRFIIMN